MEFSGAGIAGPGGADKPPVNPPARAQAAKQVDTQEHRDQARQPDWRRLGVRVRPFGDRDPAAQPAALEQTASGRHGRPLAEAPGLDYSCNTA